jgi:hypothetical protein
MDSNTVCGRQVESELTAVVLSLQVFSVHPPERLSCAIHLRQQKGTAPRIRSVTTRMVLPRLQASSASTRVTRESDEHGFDRHRLACSC